jgi:hypothetical protein
MIEITSLIETDRGRWVRHVRSGADLLGCIVRWDDHRIYVVWERNSQRPKFDSGDYVVSAMNPADLEFFHPENA